ncbi:MAG: ABC transporter permease [Bacilli bacterium]
MNALWRLASVETKLFFREKQAVFWTFLFPILMFWLFGAMFGKQKIEGFSYSDAYIPSWVAVQLLTTSLFTLGTTLTGYRETGVLRRFQATPLRPWVVLAAHIAYGLIVFIMSAIVVIAFGALAFHLNAPKHPASTIAALALSVCAIFPFGLLLASLARNTRTAAAVSSLVLNLMMFLSGATFPLSIMPKFLQGVARALPLYYVIDLLRQTWNVSPIADHMTDVAVLAGLCVISSALAARFFRWSSEA